MYFNLVKCFGINIQTGNEALVIRNCDLDIHDRLKFAVNQNKPACVFMQEDNQQLILDYYYPHKRSQLCLHATLAAAYIYFKENPSKTNVEFITSIDKQKISAQKINEDIFLVVNIKDERPIQVTSEMVIQLLNINQIYIANISIASVGSPKLLIEINEQSVLNEMNPDLEKIYNWGQENSINGCYVYFKLDNGVYIGRNFNHLNPKLEDSATGVAAGALTAQLKQDIKLYQGNNLNNECLINTKYFKDRILVGGRVTEI